MGVFLRSRNDFFDPKNNFFPTNNIFHKLSGDPGKERKCQRPPTHPPHGHTDTFSGRKSRFLTKKIKKIKKSSNCSFDVSPFHVPRALFRFTGKNRDHFDLRKRWAHYMAFLWWGKPMFFWIYEFPIELNFFFGNFSDP